MKWYRKAGYKGPAVLEAMMLKKKAVKKFFRFNYNKRWFVLNLDEGKLTYASNKNKKATSRIPFSDILSVKSESSNEELRLAIKDEKLRKLKRQLVIFTVERPYYLYF